MANYNKIKVYDYLSLSKIVAIQSLRISKNSIFEPETHDFWEFIYVRSGTLILTIEDKEYDIAANRIIFIRRILFIHGALKQMFALLMF